jgi:hypothetical protein
MLGFFFDEADTDNRVKNQLTDRAGFSWQLTTSAASELEMSW